MTWIGSVLQGSFGQCALGGERGGLLLAGSGVLSCRSSFFVFFFFALLSLPNFFLVLQVTLPPFSFLVLFFCRSSSRSDF